MDLRGYGYGLVVLASMGLTCATHGALAPESAVVVLLEGDNLEIQREAYLRILSSPATSIPEIRRRLEAMAAAPSPDEVDLNTLLYLAAYFKHPSLVEPMEKLLARIETLPDTCIYSCSILFALTLYALEGLWDPPPESETAEITHTWPGDLRHEIELAKNVDLAPKDPREEIKGPGIDHLLNEMADDSLETLLKIAGPATPDYSRRDAAVCWLEYTIHDGKHLPGLYWLAIHEVVDGACEYRYAIYRAIYRAERARRISKSGAAEVGCGAVRACTPTNALGAAVE